MEAVGRTFTTITQDIYLLGGQNGQHRGVQAFLRGHTDKVNAVKFYPRSDGQPQIILSGSVDHTVRVWRALTKRCVDFEELITLRSHRSSINCLAVASREGVFASGAADATVKIWKVNFSDAKTQFELVQTISTSPRFFPLALALVELGPTGDLMLAVAGTKSFVQMHVAERGKNFSLQATLRGHEGWVRSLAVTDGTKSMNGDILLASASQDKYIRLWRVRKGRKAPDMASSKYHALESTEKALSNKAHWLEASDLTYSLTFEALLLGHEDWVYTLSWRYDAEHLQLLSASADNSLALWEPEANSGVWVCTTRLGELNTQKGSTTATGSTGGFWIGLWSPTGEHIVCLGRTGSWRIWNYNRNLARWVQGIGICGHTKPVTDIAWAKDGTYLLSVGSDQTTRLHAEWKRNCGSSWHEMARPQIHGYDLNCLDSMSHSQFVSGGDEKLLRVFDEPRATADLIQSLCGIRTLSRKEMPEAADIPVLGLSNKVIEQTGSEEHDIGDVRGNKGLENSPMIVSENTSPATPISEDRLSRHTLWPETEKLYGHGYEISAVACNHNGSIVATACKASSIDHAVIRLYSTQKWREVKPSLTAHSLTVTCLRFSSDDRYLLSVGRDRQWVVFEIEEPGSEVYYIKHTNSKGHSRMILSASWAPLQAGVVFATAGRDKVTRLWKKKPDGIECSTTIAASSPVTAVDILPRCVNDSIIVAVGTETGEVSVYILGLSTFEIRNVYSLDEG